VSEERLTEAHAANGKGDPLLRVRDLRVHFPVRRSFLGPRAVVRAVDGVDLDIASGATLGLVGESGCGKSTLARAVLRLVPEASGEIVFHGTDVLQARGRALHRLRRDMQMVFQDPASSLNPRLTIGRSVGEPLEVQRVARGAALRARVAELLELVGLHPDDASRYPHEFSGGQRQRIVIARAIALRPRLVVCDEPVSALDVSVGAQVLNLLADLKRDLGLTYLFVAHNLAVVRYLSDAVAVMYLGKIVEQAPTADLFEKPRHPYTMLLLDSVLEPGIRRDRAREQDVVRAEPPSPLAPPTGCAFHPRCPFAVDKCRSVAPMLESVGGGIGDPGVHSVACHRADEIPSRIALWRTISLSLPPLPRGH